MRVAITATGPSLDAEVDPRFGRCPYFIIIDPDTMEFEAIENQSAMASGGAGISTAQMIAGKGAQIVLTGNSGPNAYQTLQAAGVQVINGVSGRIRDAIQGFKAGGLQPTSQPNVAAHFGMGTGTGPSTGMGGGMGMGRGMGMGGGMMPPPTPQPQSPQADLDSLKDQAQLLSQQLEELQRRIKELSEGNR